MSELFLKGLIAEYKRIFKGISLLMQIKPYVRDEFLTAQMVLTDYLKNYGEIFFHILSRQRREAIEVWVLS